ncbi:molecular chaperone [Altererythrobacter marinus]|uniref:Molecular chaperone n=1 Tax=Pelagerythrobacter marinus TaxID=538382 RepID=A0ABW9UWL0_9SPHN|nr:ATP12 family protein [Pelagerythrobacter marinus]MXO69226.1 molecular chaperone [Pelagerythrobacter marinus]
MKRFYREVSVAPHADGWRVALDGRAIRTPLGAPQVVPTRALAEAMADEWRRQGETIDTAGFVLRDLADYAIDVVRGDRAAAIDGLLAFAQTDTLCYRADPEDALYRRQHEVWEPLVTALEAREGVRLERVSGVIHRPQPAPTLAALRARLEGADDFALSGVHAMASLAASLCVALAALHDDADAEALWNAANLEEDWQAELWGRDEEAAARRDQRRTRFLAASEFAALARREWNTR